MASTDFYPVFPHEEPRYVTGANHLCIFIVLITDFESSTFKARLTRSGMKTPFTHQMADIFTAKHKLPNFIRSISYGSS